MDEMNTDVREKNAAMVLEGGGMRGLYTTGVLDAFLDDKLYFDYIIGSSAGATHALSYISRQKDRARRVNVDYVRRSDYMGLGCLLRERSLFGMDLLFNKIPYQYERYDFEAFERNVGRYFITVTNMLSGEAQYLAPRKAAEVLPAAMASCSLPFVSVPVVIDGTPFLDGGISDSVPVKKALADGNKKAVVILTQPKGYRKKISRSQLINTLAYRKHPNLARALENRTVVYNDTMDLIDVLEQEGRVFAIRPKMQRGLTRLQRNPALLNALHSSGYEDGQALRSALRLFLS